MLRDHGLGVAELRLPSPWRVAATLQEGATPQASDPVRQRFVTLVSDLREDFDPTLDLSDHAARVLTQLADSLRLISISGPWEQTVNGHRAIQFEIEGYEQGVRRVYLHTTIEGRRAFHQVLVWSTRSAYDPELFARVVGGFEELPGPEPQLVAAPPVIVEAQPHSRYAFH